MVGGPVDNPQRHAGRFERYELTRCHLEVQRRPVPGIGVLDAVVNRIEYTKQPS